MSRLDFSAFDKQIIDLSKDTHATSIRSLSTGNFLIDWATGIGGLPRGRMVEIYGPTTSGKSTVAYQAGVVCQAQGDAVLLLDYEQTFYREYGEALGLRVDGGLFGLVQPESLEDGMGLVEKVIEGNQAGLVIVDSVASMMTRRELAGDLGDDHVAPIPRALTPILKRLIDKIARSEVCLVFVNHMTETIPTGRVRIAKKKTPGGKALGFYASMRLELDLVGKHTRKQFNPFLNKNEDTQIGSKVKVSVVKSKVAYPGKEVFVNLKFGSGFSEVMSAVDVLIARGVIKKKGAWLYLPPELSGTSKSRRVNGLDAATEFLTEHQDLGAVAVTMASSYDDYSLESFGEKHES